jgi:hypothetical protein
MLVGSMALRMHDSNKGSGIQLLGWLIRSRMSFFAIAILEIIDKVQGLPPV